MTGPMTEPAYDRLFRLDGRKAIVIGAGGIGSEIARALSSFGASVVCADKDAATASQAAAAADAEWIALDITERDAVARAADKLSDLEIVVLTAAMNVRKRILDYDPGEIDRVVALNLVGTFTALQAFGRGMVDRGKGSIVVFSSVRAQVVEPGQGVYAATKAGAIQLVKTAAAEFGHAGVRVNAVAPGVVETPLTMQIKSAPDWYDAYAKKSALARWADASELVGAVIFLASDASSYVTGSTITVDGGWTAIDGRFDPPLSTAEAAPGN